jgi:hypothetical protein
LKNYLPVCTTIRVLSTFISGACFQLAWFLSLSALPGSVILPFRLSSPPDSTTTKPAYLLVSVFACLPAPFSAEASPVITM